jgi:hypothetical protein
VLYFLELSGRVDDLLALLLLLLNNFLVTGLGQELECLLVFLKRFLRKRP